MVAIGQLALRGAQLVVNIITTALIGNVIADAFAGNPGYINYAIFVCVWLWLDILYGMAAAFMESIAIPILVGVMAVLSTFFSLIAGIVLAAKLNVHSCSNSDYTSNNPATNGSADPEKRCRELQASTFFFWVLFVLFAASAALAFMSGRANVSRSSVRRPQMSKV